MVNKKLKKHLVVPYNLSCFEIVFVFLVKIIIIYV